MIPSSGKAWSRIWALTPPSIGIRIYYAVANDRDLTLRALAVGVRENGSEKDGRGGVGYKLSRPIVDGASSAAMTMADRDDARALVVLANQNNSAQPAK